jgi:hypothetical protein
VLVDDEGGVLFVDESRPNRVAVLHDHDLDLFSQLASLEGDGLGGQFHWQPGLAITIEAIRRADVPGRFGFVASPAAMNATTG